jgi:hypothetical protein
MKKQEVKVDLQVLQELIDYLQLKPYNEVSQLISKIIQEVNKEEE